MDVQLQQEGPSVEGLGINSFKVIAFTEVESSNEFQEGFSLGLIQCHMLRIKFCFISK